MPRPNSLTLNPIITHGSTFHFLCHYPYITPIYKFKTTLVVRIVGLLGADLGVPLQDLRVLGRYIPCELDRIWNSPIGLRFRI